VRIGPVGMKGNKGDSEEPGEAGQAGTSLNAYLLKCHHTAQSDKHYPTMSSWISTIVGRI